MNTFEDTLNQYEPMISSCIRKLNIYKNHELYRQAGRIALWRAWVKFEAEKGEFAPYAYRCIYGSMLDELKKEKHEEETINPIEDEKLSFLLEQALVKSIQNEDLSLALETLTTNERELILWIFVEGISLQQAATRAGITIPGIKKRRERMLNKLRNSLKVKK
ncbi:sigma-70 family RNA polymerase sigma factor [Psychrobacillus sp. FJAT-51614]|uniref:Sigma-70 family RNA polymerase sigma factor n=1 Tax=Psychrobacillus mangrovi TaxID=3117745 RepID=A0ABU8F128_9BACI